MSTPATLPSLALWFDGGQVAYSDAGTTIAAAPYGRVQQIAQPAPLTGNWTASGGSRPWRESSSLDFHVGDPSLILPPAPALAVPANNCTIALAWQSRGGEAIIPLIYATHSGGDALALLMQGLFLLHSPATGSISAGLPVPGPGHLVAQCTLLVTCSPTQFEFRLTVNGTAYSSIVATAPTAGTLTAFQLGRWTGYADGQMCVSQYVVTAAALNSTDQAALQAYLLTKLADEPSLAAPLVVMLGDSIGAAWTPNYQTALNSLPNPPRVINVAVPGAGTTNPASIPSFYTTDALPHYSASRAKNIIVCEGISLNDIGNTGTPAATAATVLAAYYALLDRARADGWIVVACTLSPTTSGSGYDAARAIVNADIRANYLAHAHYLNDNGAAPGMSTSTDAANLTYFLDGTHPAPAGYLVWDPILVPVLQAILATPDTRPVPDLLIAGDAAQLRALDVKRYLSMRSESH